MNETITIELKRNGELLPIQRLSAQGITIADELDATPRRLTIALAPAEEYTRERIRRVQFLNDWPAFTLKCAVKEGGLVLSGYQDNPRGLPMGNYRLHVTIDDLIIRQDACFTLNEGEHERLVLEVAPDPRTVKVSPPAEFDERILRVLTAPQSVLDGQQVTEWLQGGKPRPQRKACLLNIMAKLRTTPHPSQPLLEHVINVFYADVDRIYVTVTPDFLARLRNLAADPRQPFYCEGVPHAPIHELLRERAAVLEPQARNFELESFRQEGRNSLQAVVAHDLAGGDAYADLDIDLGNPLQDLQGLAIHCAEVLNPTKTDHLALRQCFAVGPMADFAYYTVSKA